MANLLSCLKADEEYNKYIGQQESDDDEDEDISEMMGRRMSMNQFNETGLNFQKY